MFFQMCKANMTVFGAVASDGKVIPVHFIEACLKINIENYFNIVKEVLIPWIKKKCDPKNLMFIQDSIPAHESKKMQTFLRTELPHFVSSDICPFSSPD